MTSRGFLAVLPMLFIVATMTALGYCPVQAASRVFHITDIQLNQKTGQVLIKGDHRVSDTDARNFSAIKLPNPDRLVIDIPGAQPPVGKAVYPVNSNGIQKIEVSQSDSAFYTATRLVIYVDNTQTLWQLNTATDGKMLTVGAGSKDNGALTAAAATPATVAPTPAVLAIPADRTVVDAVAYKDGVLTVHAKNSAALHVKNRFTLTEPGRLVLDLDNTYIASRELTKAIAVPANGDISAIRVGQFDDATVRIVIETAMPEKIQVSYPASDQSQLAISPYTDNSAATLPSDVQLGHLDNVVVDKQGDDTVVHITTSMPMVHRVMRDDENIYVDFLNIAGAPGWVKFDPAAFPELKFLKVEPLTAGQPNSKLVVDMNNPQFEVSPRISDDGKSLDLVLTKAAPMLTLSSAQKAPFPARIVVDAGHGGKDQGASRDGVLEKDLNLQVAFLLRDALKARGFQVYMTRTDDTFVPLPDISNYANSVHPDVFVSVHQNASVNAGLDGMEVYYYMPNSEALANSVDHELANDVNAVNRGVKTARFYVIHHTSAPAILCEVGYMSNEEELQALQTKDRQMRTANAIADGIVNFLKGQVTAQAQKPVKP